MRKQNVSASVAVIVILVAVIVLSAVFSKANLAPPDEAPSKPVPSEPQISTDQQNNERKGTMPLGLSLLFPPLPEDRMQVARVARMNPDGPAARAGLKVGDAIVGFNGKPITTGDALIYYLNKVQSDRSYPVKVVRTELDKSGHPVKRTLTLQVTGIVALPLEEQVKF